MESTKKNLGWWWLTALLVLSLCGLSPALASPAMAYGESVGETKITGFGEEPRSLFRFALRAGTVVETRLSTTNESQVTFSSKMDLPFPKIPVVKAVLEMVYRSTIVEIQEDGRALVEQVVTLFEGSSGQIEMAFLNELVGVVFTYKVDSMGQISDVKVKKGLAFSAPKDAVALMPMLTPVTDEQGLALIMQDKPVGVGATWTSQFTSSNQGPQIKATATGKVTAITSDSFAIASHQKNDSPSIVKLEGAHESRLDSSTEVSANYIKTMPMPQRMESIVMSKVEVDMKVDGRAWTQGQVTKMKVVGESKIVSEAPAK